MQRGQGITHVSVDTLQSAREFRDAGIESRKAEAIASMTHRAISDSQAPLATKADLSAFRSDFAAFKSDLSAQLARQEARLIERISAVEKRVSEVDSRVSAVDSRVSSVHSRISSVDSRISEVHSRFHRTIWAHSIAIIGLTVALLRFL